jgi:hypothetical protein
MTTGFQFFEGTRSTTTSPQVTVRRSGQMVLTPAAVAMLGDDATHVQFGYDPDTRTVAVRSAPKGAKGRYRLRSQANGSSLVDGRRFMAHYELQVEKAQRFPAEELAEGMVGFRLVDEVDTADADIPDDDEGTEAQAPAPAKKAKPARSTKRKAAVATA